MDDFDRLLEAKLRRLLDPIVAKPPPARRGTRSRPLVCRLGRFDGPPS
jgi:hypothetical protein